MSRTTVALIRLRKPCQPGRRVFSLPRLAVALVAMIRTSNPATLLSQVTCTTG